ncbi:hypothetical protein B7463_g5505, partial [Scytalidium lignicola]
MAPSKSVAIGTQKKKSVAPKLPVQPTPTFKSNELVTNSDEESSSDSTEPSSDDENSPANTRIALSNPNGKSATSKAAKANSPQRTVNGKKGTSTYTTKLKDASENSSNESSSEESSEGEDEDDSEQDDQNASEAESSGEEGEGDDEDEDQETNITAPGKQTSKQDHKKPASLQEPPLYTPPSGFNPVTVGENEITRTSELFKTSTLEGKQIWHIVAPASVPLETLKQISLQDINKSKAILSFNGDKYGFVEDKRENSKSTKVITPKGSSSYKTGGRTVDKILRLQQMVELPVLQNSSSSHKNPRATIPTPKPVRQQPKGLKMRFLPIGFGSGNPGTLGVDSSLAESSSAESESDEEMRDIPNQSPSTSKIQPNTSLSSESSNEEDSNSDVEMTEILPNRPKPILPPKFMNISQPDKLQSKSPSEKHSNLQSTSHKTKTPILPPSTSAFKSIKPESQTSSQVSSSQTASQDPKQQAVKPSKRKNIDIDSGKAKSGMFKPILL